MRLPDVNVLLHAANLASPRHAVAAHWLEGAADPGRGLALPWVSLLGFIRLATRPGAYSVPMTVAQAMSLVDAWLLAPGARVVHPGSGHARVLNELLQSAGTAGNLTTDAHLAALALEHGATVGTFDRDFKRFSGVRVDLLGQN